MRVIGRIFAVLFAIIFVLTLPVALTLYNVQAGLVSPTTYKSVLVDDKIYEQAPQAAASELLNYISKDGVPSDLKTLNNFSADELAKALNALLPAGMLQPLAESLIDQIFTIINESKGSIKVDLTAIKQNISTNSVSALHDLVAGKPPCSHDELTQFQNGGLPFCNPPKDIAAQYDARMSKQLGTLANNLPDNMELLPEAKVNAMQEQLTYISIMRNVAMTSLLVPLICLGLIALFTVRSKKSLMRWWGVPLLIAGFISIMLDRTAHMMGNNAMQEKIGTLGLTDTGSTLLLQLYRGVAGAVLSPMYIESALAVLIGIALIVGPRWLADPEPVREV